MVYPNGVNPPGGGKQVNVYLSNVTDAISFGEVIADTATGSTDNILVVLWLLACTAASARPMKG